METALFYVLLGTGLRESEIVTLNVSQYRNKGFHDVLRHKSKRVSLKIPLPQETRDFLDDYLEGRATEFLANSVMTLLCLFCPSEILSFPG